MRAKPIAIGLFVSSLGVGGFALLNAQKGDTAVPTEQILTASTALSTGTLLRAQDITWQSLQKPQADHIKRPSEAAVIAKPDIIEETTAKLYGAVLRHALPAGEPIRYGDVVKPGDRDFLQVVLSPGQRAIAIPVSTGGASTGLLTPGDRVDVILTQNFKNDSNAEVKTTPLTRRSVGETIAHNLRILAVDAPDPKKTATPNAGGFGRTVTLEVTPQQAEDINVAVELGKLSLTLRNIGSGNVASEPVKPRWAGDVSPALAEAPQPKPTAIAAKQVIVLRGNLADKGREVVKFDDGEKK